MNVVGIFFQLLITGMFYKRGFCPNPDLDYNFLLSGVEVWNHETGEKIGTFSSAYLGKFKDCESFVIGDMNDRMLREDIFRNKPFPPSQFEFVSLYELRLLSLFRREDDNSLVYVLCKFLGKDHLQTFFDSMFYTKAIGPTMKIRSMYQYTIPDASNSNNIPQMVPFVRDAELTVRKTSDTTIVEKTVYYITHVSNTTDKVDVDLIFASEGFRVSATYVKSFLALCVTHAPDNVGFLIRFADGRTAQKFVNEYMPIEVQSHKTCDFSDTWLRENYAFVNN